MIKGWFIIRRLPNPSFVLADDFESAFWPDPDLNKFLDKFHIEYKDLCECRIVTYVYPEEN